MDSRKGSGESLSSDGDEAKPIEPNKTGNNNKLAIGNSSPSFMKAVAQFVSSNQPCTSKPNYQIIWFDQSLDSTVYQVYISALDQLNFANLDGVKSLEDFSALYDNKLLHKHVFIIVNDSCS